MVNTHDHPDPLGSGESPCSTDITIFVSAVKSIQYDDTTLRLVAVQIKVNALR